LALQKDLGPVFDITLDCEDGAPVGQESEHAALVVDILHSPDHIHGRVGVRIHDPSHPCWLSDIQTILSLAGKQVAFIMIPKVSGVAQTQMVLDAINQASQHAGLTQRIPVQVLIETHSALREVFELAALPQVESLSFGLMDFVSAHHGAIPSDAMDRGQFDHPLIARAMLEISAACHAFGKVPAHNVCTNFKDEAIIRSDCLRAKNEFGYTRKWSIHPNQIPIIVAALTPSNDEIETAWAIIHAAMTADWGPIQMNGVLHDRASYRYYWTVLQKASAAGLKLPEAAKKLF
jgi:citrate lyase subunit beta/citryl-CoA lyase